MPVPVTISSVTVSPVMVSPVVAVTICIITMVATITNYHLIVSSAIGSVLFYIPVVMQPGPAFVYHYFVPMIHVIITVLRRQ